MKGADAVLVATCSGPRDMRAFLELTAEPCGTHCPHSPPRRKRMSGASFFRTRCVSPVAKNVETPVRGFYLQPLT